jgi:hypothetical protein
LTPGDLEFESLLKVMNELAEDGELGKMGDDVGFMGVVFELTDTHLIGPMKEVLEGGYKDKGETIGRLRSELLRRYDTHEGLRKLMVRLEGS